MAGESFKLPTEKVEVKYIKRQKGIITDPKHIAYGGLLEGAYITLPPKRLRNGQYANVLTNDEKRYLEKVLALPEDGLSIYNKTNNYWGTLKVRIGKEGIPELDLSDPISYIQYKILMSYDDIVCDNIENVDRKPTYKFVIVRTGDIQRQTNKKLDLTKEAYKLLGKLEDNREAMIDFLRVVSIKVADDTSTDWLNGEVGKYMLENTTKFVTLLKDPSYTTRVLLTKAIASGEVVKKGMNYYTKDGESLSEPNTQSTLENVITYLESSVNQEYRLLLMSKVK